jgi:3-deoxy-manno-octulosonate cytidylyltransferase (CMP-KDO synthetase)
VPASSTAVVAAIPARYGSTRLPGKPLWPLAGKPMIQHVYENARRARGIDRVVVLTDDDRVAAAVEAFAGEVEITPAECSSGTDRIAWAAREWPATTILNVQGDEPLMDTAAIEQLAAHMASHPEDEMATLATAAEPGDLENPNTVKVVLDRAGYGLYFSRAPIPFPRLPGVAPVRKHLGIYAYRRAILLRLAALAPTDLERAESLEQLRALEHGLRIRVLMTTTNSWGVDTHDDAERVDRLLRARAAQG